MTTVLKKKCNNSLGGLAPYIPYFHQRKFGVGITSQTTSDTHFTLRDPMEFLKGTSTSGNDQVKAYIRYGSWSEATIKHYNAGVSKLVSFADAFSIPRSDLLPVKPEILYQFVLWAWPKLPGNEDLVCNASIKSSTIRT